MDATELERKFRARQERLGQGWDALPRLVGGNLAGPPTASSPAQPAPANGTAQEDEGKEDGEEEEQAAGSISESEEECAHSDAEGDVGAC
jgi:hypothetical protein